MPSSCPSSAPGTCPSATLTDVRLPSRRGVGLGWATLAVAWLVSHNALAADPTAPAAIEPAGRALTPALAALLGAIQGATEFLPVSSSGHLSLGQAWLDIDPSTAGHRFNIAVHAATLVAVVWVYRSEVWALLRAACTPWRPTVETTRILMMLLASLPLGIVLIPAVEHLVIAMETRVRLIGIALWTTALVLFLAFRDQAPSDAQPSPAPPRPWQAILIGLAQVCAVLPGISRSGSTIAAGLGVGLSRANAARFSFLISLIAVGGATAKEGLDALKDGGATPIEPVAFLVGFMSSLVIGLLSLRGLLYLVRRGRIMGFVVYLAFIGAVAVITG